MYIMNPSTEIQTVTNELQNALYLLTYSTIRKTKTTRNSAAGLNPTNTESIFALEIQSNSLGLWLGWEAVSGRVYHVNGSTNLLTGFEAVETNILWPQNSWTTQVSETFYKLKVELIP